MQCESLSRIRTSSAPARAAFWYVVCNILQKGIAFLVVPVYTRMLTTSEYGAYMVFQSWREILIIFATLNLYAGVFTKAMVDYQYDRDRYSSCMQGLSTVLTLALFCVFLVAPGFWCDFLEMDAPTVAMLFLYFFVFPSFSFWSVRQRVEYKYRAMVAVTLVSSVMAPAVSVALLLLTDLREAAVIWGFLVSQVAVGMFFYVLLFARGRVFFVGEYWAFALRYNIPLIPHYLSLVALGQIDRIMVSDMRGQAEAGVYALGYQISMAMNVVIAGVNGSLVPWIYEHLRDGAFGRIRSVCNGLCAVLLAGTALAMLVGPEIVMLMGSTEFSAAAQIVPAVMAGVFFTFCYGLFACIEFYYAKTVYVTVATAASAVINIALNLAFIPEYGFVAAGYATMASYAALLVIHWAFSMRICRMLDVAKGAFDSRAIFLMSAAMALAAFGCLAIYGLPLLRYALVAAALVSAVALRGRILSLVKTIRQ